MTKKEFDECLERFGLTRQLFAQFTGLSYGSVTNWNDDKKPVPSWVGSWLRLFGDYLLSGFNRDLYVFHWTRSLVLEGGRLRDQLGHLCASVYRHVSLYSL